MKALAKSLELSSCAAAWVGPKIFSPARLNASTTPSASVASGPTTVRPMRSRCANATRSAIEVNATLLSSRSRAVPALPGATKTFATRLDCAIFHANACSRPPPPMTRIFIASAHASVHASARFLTRTPHDGGKARGRALAGDLCRLVAKVPHAGKHHRQTALVGRGDDFSIAHAAAGLDDRDRAGVRDDIEAVPKREERVGSNHRPGER